MTDTAIMLATETPEMLSIRAHATRFCDERSLTTIEDLSRVMGAMAHQAFLRDIEPFIKMKIGIIGLEMPSYMLSADGQMTTAEPVRSDATKNTLHQIDAMIADVAARYGVAQES